MRGWLIGIDVGGTFTDGVLVRPGEPTLDAKALTDQRDPMAGLRGCLDRLAEAAGTDRGGLLARTAKLAYGTTHAVNLVVQGKGARTGFITTRGFRDTLVIAGIGRDRIGQDLTASRAPSLVPRRLIHEVRERVDVAGREVAPLRVEDVRAAMAALEAEGVEAVGVCLLWSFRDASHERAVGELLRAHDGWFVTLSSDVAPFMGEYERSATTALNATLGPPLERHLSTIDRELTADGLGVPLLIMQSSGGLLPVRDAARVPVSLIASGPAGGVLAAKLLADALGAPNVIAIDMGGTTFDVSLITDGAFARSERTQFAGQELFLPAIDIHSIGAGGGSLGWIDHGSRLKVGPESAGAHPGPACYGNGGTRATVTDANVELGRINTDGLAGGRIALDREASRRALADLGAPLAMDARATAEGMIAIVDAAMSDAIRLMTVRRGLDPADYTLFAFGGAGALHAVALARELGIRRVVVPALASVLSAYGIVASDILHVVAITEARPLEDADAIAAAYARLEADADRQLAADGIATADRSLRRSAQVRFRGQLHAVEIPVADGAIDPARMRHDFLREYERLYGQGTASPQAGIEAITLRVDAVGRTHRPPLSPAPTRRRAATPVGERAVWHEGASVAAKRYDGRALEPGDELVGPAVVDDPGSTTWIPSGVRAHVDGLKDLVLEVEG
ncbi:MAG: hydantoinase/oxoprolinase family protein [Chloroflexota bacterium]|nr:hydantoinase/oxoprolinase family protein [Chloroflexota bacterium]